MINSKKKLVTGGYEFIGSNFKLDILFLSITFDWHTNG